MRRSKKGGLTATFFSGAVLKFRALVIRGTGLRAGPHCMRTLTDHTECKSYVMCSA